MSLVDFFAGLLVGGILIASFWVIDLAHIIKKNRQVRDAILADTAHIRALYLSKKSNGESADAYNSDMDRIDGT